MICAASNTHNGGTSTQTTLQQSHCSMMMPTEDYYKQHSDTRNKVENLYTMNNNNTMIQENLNQNNFDKMTTTAILNEMNEYKNLNGQSNGSNLDEHRALQLALELSMLGLTNNDEDINFNDMRLKKSMNMTECVPVPSSEHVAEIVGRQGCKIKALRAKTNTYIKTPVRGEEPVFVVTGRKEDVTLAKREIMQAAEHFSQIRASRRNSATLSPLGPPSPTAPGHVTKQVRVPYRVVGLVVGPKGSTIKRIQQATNTYIVTPSRDKEPVFEVTGLPENVDRAKREVEHHIALRTGGIIDPTHPESSEHMVNGFSSSLFSPTGSSSGSFGTLLDHNHDSHLHQRSQSVDSYGYLSGQSSGSSKFSDLSSSATSPFANNAFFYDTVIPSPTTDLENMGQFDPAPGSPSPSVWPDMIQRNSLINRAVGTQPQVTSTRSISVNAYSSHDNSGRSSPANYRRLLSESGVADPYQNLQSTYSQFNGTTVTSTVQAQSGPEITSIIDMSKIATSDGESQSSSPDWLATSSNSKLPPQGSLKKQCYICQSSKVVAALVPCGHNLFCMECAEQAKEAEGECPACQRKIEAVLRIFS